MALDPMTIALISGLLQGAGGLFGGMQQAGAQNAGTEEQRRQFDLMRKERLGRGLETAPMRDRLAYMLQARLGLPEREMKVHDIFNPSYGSGQAQQGGYDRTAYADLVKAYQPGMGGMLGGGGGVDDLMNQEDISSFWDAYPRTSLGQVPYLDFMTRKAISKTKYGKGP